MGNDAQVREKHNTSYQRRRFEDRCAVITGGTSGAGKATAERIVAEGGQVALWDISGPDTPTSWKGEGASFVLRVDVSDLDQVKRAAELTAHTFGKIDILVNSAGITGVTAPVTKYPVESWKKVMGINLDGTFFCCRSVVPFMQVHSYGRIVNIASVAGKEGNPNASAYSASKAAVIGFTKSLGKELADCGILVNAISPATFESPILEQLPQSQIDYMKAKIPMGRLGTVEEIAALVCWLASEECSFSTAATFDISGGRTTY